MAPQNDILAELQDIAPAFAGMYIKHPYQTPAAYFDTLADVVLSRVRALKANSAAEEVQMISPGLGELKKGLPFKTPEGYFEKLSPKVPDLKKDSGRVIRIPFGRLAAAAIIAGLILTGVWMYLNQSTSNDRETLAASTNNATHQTILQKVDQVSDAEIIQYVEQNYTLINLYTLETEPEAGEETGNEGLSLILTEVSDQELENYLARSNF